MPVKSLILVAWLKSSFVQSSGHNIHHLAEIKLLALLEQVIDQCGYALFSDIKIQFLDFRVNLDCIKA